MTACPRCSAPLEGLAAFCHSCQEYTADMGSSKVHAREHLGDGQADTRSEAEIRIAIRRALEALGFVVVDFEQGFRKDGSTRVRKGLPDLYVMGFGIGVWRELKAAKGRLSPEQEAFGEDCRRCGIDWGVWRHESQAITWAQTIRRAA